MKPMLFSLIHWYHFFYLFFIVFSAWRCGRGWILGRRGWVTLSLAALLLFAAIAALPVMFPIPWLTGALVLGFALYVVEWPLSLIFPRRRRAFNGAVLLLLPALVAFGIWNGTVRLPVVREVSVPWPGLPPAMQNFIIVQVSDLHAGPRTSLAWLAGVVERINGLQPDLIAFTGDTISGNITDGRLELFQKLHARHGIFLVVGNHEKDPESGRHYLPLLTTLPDVHLLRDTVVTIPPGLQLAGIWDEEELIFENRPELWRKHLLRLHSRFDPDLPLVLLSHRPSPFLPAVQAGVDLQLSGHLHAGQLPPVNLALWLLLPYLHGSYRSGNATLVVSAGAGVWEYLPLRLGTRGEIVRLRLERQVR